MRKLLKTFIKFLIVTTAMRLVGMLISRAYEGESTASDDDFKLMALMSGRLLMSESSALRTGTAVAALGGIDIDLAEADLDPGGAHISLKAYAGGIRMNVPAEWKVYVDQDARAGGIKIETSDPDTLPDDAPRLTVEAVTRSGGILIESEVPAPTATP
jgi:hypothetical protein